MTRWMLLDMQDASLARKSRLLALQRTCCMMWYVITLTATAAKLSMVRCNHGRICT
jgi:hypothetical protein